MRLVSLASGSSGNCILVDDGDTRLLVDCGIGPRTLKQRLTTAGVAPESISGVLVTHEHIDHVRGLEAAVAKWAWPVMGSAGTLHDLPAAVRPHAKPVRERGQVGGLQFELIPVAHDAHEPTAYAITARASGIRVGIAHDLGAPSDRLVAAFRGVDLLCIEANHDVEMLRAGPYPAYLKARIASGTGHLSNDQTAAFMDAVSTPALRAVLLLHLSEVNNPPDVACASTKRGMHRRARTASLAAAVRRAPSAPIGMARAAQLALAI